MSGDGPTRVPADEDQRETLRQARDRAARLLDQLRRDARDLETPSRLVPREALAQGRAAYERAAAAAEALLRELGAEEPDDSPHPR